MLKLVSNQPLAQSMSKSPELFDYDYLLHLMKLGEIVLQQESKDGFIYAIDSYGDVLAINQAIAKQVIKNPLVLQERWREGWNETKETGRVRWLCN